MSSTRNKRETYASPMSFVGSTRRTARWVHSQSAWLWTIAAPALLMFWMFLLVWYFIVFGVFGLIAIPFRSHRRHQRKELAVQQRQLEAIERMAASQGTQPPE